MITEDVVNTLAYAVGESITSVLIDMLVATEGFTEERAVAFAQRFVIAWAVAWEQAANSQTEGEKE